MLFIISKCWTKNVQSNNVQNNNIKSAGNKKQFFLTKRCNIAKIYE